MSRYNNTTFKSKLLFIDIFNKLLDSDIHPDVFFFFDSDKKIKKSIFVGFFFGDQELESDLSLSLYILYQSIPVWHRNDCRKLQRRTCLVVVVGRAPMERRRGEELPISPHMAWKAKGAVRSLSMIFLQWKDHTRFHWCVWKSDFSNKNNFYHKQRNSE